MAKKKGQVVKLWLLCSDCNTQNYITKLNKLTTQKMLVNKFCNNCRKHAPHKGREKLK